MAQRDDFGEELADFVHRIAELKSARGVPEGDLPAVLDAAIFELDHVAGRLWPLYERLVTDGGSAGSPPSADRLEQQLLRALFQRFPLPVALVDRESVVRRMNFAATGLTGVRAGYATGRPLTGLLGHPDRAAFRSQVAAVARGEGDRSLVVHLQQSPALPVRATLTPLRPTNEPRIVVLVVLQPARDTAGSDPAPAPRTGGPHTPDLTETTRHAALLELLDTMATTLLTAPAGDPAVVLRRAAGVLHGRFADWVVAETGAARLHRVTVLAPDGPGADPLAEALTKQEPSGCPLVVEAARGGSTALQVRPEDPEAFGHDPAGDPVLVRANVTSLLCLPLTDPRDGAVQGVLTLFRTGARDAFSMAEAQAADTMARHLALAIRRRP
ncbi:PAS domain-containing protein [Streptomyces sp. NPDC058045]|uniref:PAS domain-containing protein n=1 Tax=Streptomyces sp. NPDC058045 TaxID=3346311 RepID=UPI0036F039B2